MRGRKEGSEEGREGGREGVREGDASCMFYSLICIWIAKKVGREEGREGEREGWYIFLLIQRINE